MTKVVVVGAGAAGISAAFWLSRNGAEVEVLEADLEVGGRCRTVTKGDFRFDIGAGALPSTYGAVTRLIDALGVGPDVERRGAVIGTLWEGQVSRIDRRRPLTFLRAEHLPPRSKARLWRFGLELARMYRSINPTDMSSAARFDTQSVSQWCDAALDDVLRERFIACLCRALFLVEPEHTSVVDLFSAAKSLLVAGHLLTHPDGVGFFLERAASRLDVHLGVEVTDVRRDGRGVVVSGHGPDGPFSRSADGCVVALPAPAAARVVRDLDIAPFLEGLEHSSAIVVHLGLARAPEERSSMVLVPRALDPAMPVVGLGHNLGPGRAPPGSGVLAAFYMSAWSEAHWGSADDALVAETAARIERLLPGWFFGRPADVVASHVTRWRPALVATRPGTYRELAIAMARDRADDPIQLAGDWMAQSSVNAAVASGERAALRLS
jgi:oxygen-dependent protoporphyrinogen oxidase